MIEIVVLKEFARQRTSPYSFAAFIVTGTGAALHDGIVLIFGISQMGCSGLIWFSSLYGVIVIFEKTTRIDNLFLFWMATGRGSGAMRLTCLLLNSIPRITFTSSIGVTLNRTRGIY